MVAADDAFPGLPTTAWNAAAAMGAINRAPRMAARVAGRRRAIAV